MVFPLPMPGREPVAGSMRAGVGSAPPSQPENPGQDGFCFERQLAIARDQRRCISPPVGSDSQLALSA
jgi:hypothetical protein